MGYFGNKTANEIPDRLDLPAGDYHRVEIKNIREFITKDKSTKIIVTFRDIDPESPTSGLSFDWWINTPDQTDPKTFTYFKNNLRTIGVSEDEMDEVNFAQGADKRPSEDAQRFIGGTGSLSLTSAMSKGKEYINLKYFRLDEGESDKSQMDDPWVKEEPEAEKAADGAVDDFLAGL